MLFSKLRWSFPWSLTCALIETFSWLHTSKGSKAFPWLPACTASESILLCIRYSCQSCRDGLLGQMCDMLPKPFHERTATEKEILYERIADQLAAIADHYNMGSPHSRKNSPTEVFNTVDLLQESSGSSELEGAVARRPGVLRSESRKSKSSEDEDKLPPVTDTERELAAVLRARGDAASQSPLTDMTPLVRDLVSSVSYSDFQQILGAKLGPNPGWHQVAMMFRLTQTAVQLAGMGTTVAARMKENTLKYFEDKMAGWIVKQGGWESMVEDTNSELD